ncbi:macro domain-containing protein [Knoellia locipacati]|uniref:type II toxin-antitoxin system antitoxin DNA ADP-ribosyl glycohydrolase DarG n=1 Tax=Knoellia locipacati TaxID=882824 RepID=UPI00385107DF
MISYAEGNLLQADVDALINTVNTVGIMGKGIALQFKRAYPHMFKAYERAAKARELSIGRMHVWPTEQMTGPRFIINFPTKSHWKSRSQLSDVERGLDALVDVIHAEGIRSIAVPPLGCGNGGLDWRDVEPLIVRKLSPLTDVDVIIYPPNGAPAAVDMPNAEAKPDMTAGRAALISLMAGYETHALAMPSLIESQKLMYFLQEAGEPLRLEFTKHLYGPYADNLRHVLRVVEGHYVTGYGDGSSPVQEAEPLTVLPGALEEAQPVLQAHPETNQRIERVLELAAGFESAYGLELLATVHWVVRENPAQADDLDAVVDGVQRWSSRKGRMFSRDHIETAWQSLRDRGWIRTLTSV